MGSAALNIFGYVKGYRYFVYSLNEGGGDGSLQFGAMIAILIVSLLAAVIALSCVKSYKSGIAVPVKAAVGAAPKAAKPKKDKVKFTERAKKFWRDYKSEFKKIVWPSKEETTKSTVVVVSTIVVFAVAIAILDFIFSKGLTLLSHL